MGNAGRGPAAAAAGLVLAGAAWPVNAQGTAPFYKGKTISVISGFTPGGSYDYYTRLFARHVGRYISGNPTVIVQGMPGAGGLNAANHMFKVAARDGTVLAMLSQTLAVGEAMGTPGIQYNSGAFGWIGRLSTSVEVTVTWHTSKARTIEDARTHEVLLASSGPGSALDNYPRVLAFASGLKLRIVSGYKGSTEALLAMERGEVDGTGTTWNTLKINRKPWLDGKRVNILVQHTSGRSPELPDVPAAVEFGRTVEDRALLAFYMSGGEIGRSILTTPGVPADRLAELRAAFDKTMQDAELQGEIRKANAEFAPLSGVELQKLVAATLAVRPEIAARVREVLQGKR